jgi:hypothetical protein
VFFDGLYCRIKIIPRLCKKGLIWSQLIIIFTIEASNTKQHAFGYKLSIATMAGSPLQLELVAERTGALSRFQGIPVVLCVNLEWFLWLKVALFLVALSFDLQLDAACFF